MKKATPRKASPTKASPTKASPSRRKSPVMKAKDNPYMASKPKKYC